MMDPAQQRAARAAVEMRDDADGVRWITFARPAKLNAPPTGDGYPIAELAPLGLFNAVVPADQLLDATRRMLERVTPWSVLAVAAQRRLFEVWQNGSLVDGISASLDEFAQVFASPETAARVATRRASVGRRQDVARHPDPLAGPDASAREPLGMSDTRL